MDCVYCFDFYELEQLKENKREISKSVRELDRERAKLEAEEKRLIHDIRQAAQKGEMVKKCDDKIMK